MSDAQASTYDEVSYGGNCFFYTHPDALATIATLFGMRPPPVERCRVLELGCADGSNLIPMAASRPDEEAFSPIPTHLSPNTRN